MKDYSVLNGMIENQKSELRTAYDKGYNQGVKDYDLIFATSKKEEEGYNRGLESAWSCAKRIMSMPLSDQEKIFNMQDERAIMDAHSAEEAIDILKRYDEKHYDLPESMRGEIKVGDIVEIRGFSKPVIVINTPFDFEDSDEIKVMNYLGDTAWVKIENCSMTGRHIDKLAETFEQLKNE